MNEDDFLEFLDENDEEINDKWLIPESKLDDVQEKILNTFDGNMVIKGCAGSGKTILAIYKLAKILSEELGSYAFVVYTVTLKEFIKNGIEQFEELRDQLKNLNVYYKKEFVELVEKDNFEKVDYLFIDEAQDLDVDFIKKLYTYVDKDIIILGDDEQQIYTIRNKGTSINRIAQAIEFEENNINLLETNYRVPKSVAKFAGNIIDDNNKLYNRCVREYGREPIVKKYDSFEEELDRIIDFIKEESLTDVAILVQFNRDVIKVKNYFKKRSLDIEYKYNDENGRVVNNIDFTNNIVKVLTYHSSKGLEFDYVFLPKCEDIEEEIDKKYRYKQALYVACTRVKKLLVISYSNNLNKYIYNILSESE